MPGEKKITVNIQANIPYQIISKETGKAVQAGVNDQVFLYDPSGNEDQLWNFVPVGEHYKIVSRISQELLDVSLDGTENGTYIHQWEDVNAENQIWRVDPYEDGSVALIAPKSGRCADIVNLSHDNGAHIQLWDLSGGDNQKWLLVSPAEGAPAAVKAEEEPAAETPVSVPAGGDSVKTLEVVTDTVSEEPVIAAFEKPKKSKASAKTARTARTEKTEKAEKTEKKESPKKAPARKKSVKKSEE
ncbi:MAG: RICIN domain-containing protein [Oscillospiraceae bacterium]|jgi:hypothetical protein|nr:RICIN domain-containing protein [Oscillospiraceae bacterium]